MRWPILLLAAALACASGCATGYTAKSSEQAREKPKQTLVLVEGLVFQPQTSTNPPALIRSESVAFGDAVASGVCARLEKQGIDAVSLVLAGVQQRDFTTWVADMLQATNAEPAVVPVVAPEKWTVNPAKAAALSAIFTALDSYDQSAMVIGAPPKMKLPKPVGAAKLTFSPDDFTTLFGRSMTSVVVLVEGGAYARRKGSSMKDLGVALGVGLASAILSGGTVVAVPGMPIFPCVLKAVAVDTSTGEVLWADTWTSKNEYRSGYHGTQETGGDYLIRRCPLFKAEK